MPFSRTRIDFAAIRRRKDQVREDKQAHEIALQELRNQGGLNVANVGLGKQRLANAGSLAQTRLAYGEGSPAMLKAKGQQSLFDFYKEQLKKDLGGGGGSSGVSSEGGSSNSNPTVGVSPGRYSNSGKPVSFRDLNPSAGLTGSAATISAAPGPPVPHRHFGNAPTPKIENFSDFLYSPFVADETARRQLNRGRSAYKGDTLHGDMFDKLFGIFGDTGKDINSFITEEVRRKQSRRY